jgi:hypothetical protein
MLYIDQPIGASFSYKYGSSQRNAGVKSSVAAAPFTRNFQQAFFAHFPEYKSRDFKLSAEPYGGPYGPGESPPVSPISVVCHSSQYEDNGIKYREYRALGDFQALQRTDQGSKLATRPYISRPFP